MKPPKPEKLPQDLIAEHNRAEEAHRLLELELVDLEAEDARAAARLTPAERAKRKEHPRIKEVRDARAAAHARRDARRAERDAGLAAWRAFHDAEEAEEREVDEERRKGRLLHAHRFNPDVLADLGITVPKRVVAFPQAGES